MLGRHEMGDEIRYMMEQEVKHLKTFDKPINERKVRPSSLDPIWRTAGLALGLVTASMGTKAAMACIIAVEEVIGEHYQKQAANLGFDEASLKGYAMKNSNTGTLRSSIRGMKLGITKCCMI